MSKWALMFVGLFFVSAVPVNAADQAHPQNKWLVMQLSGEARVIHPGLQPASLKLNAQIEPGDTLVTGTSGRATLVRGADYIVIAPRSELRLPTATQPSGFTHVIENLGTMLFKIQHTGVPHFVVDTPMLAAVVKGTTFTVVVDHDRSAVQVIQGIVQVTAVEGGMTRMVEGGRTVFVKHDNPKVLLDADKPSLGSSPSSGGVRVSAAATDPLTSISELTGGLVHAGQSPQASVGSQSVAVTVQTQPAAGTPSITSAAGLLVASSPAVTGPTTAPGSVPSAALALLATGTPPLAAATPSATTIAIANPQSSATTPTVVVATVSSQTLTTSAATVPSVSTPAVTTPAATVPSVSTPAVTTPAATVPSVSTPAVTTPAATVPSVSTPSVAIPPATVPSVTTPAITPPVVTLP